MLESSDETRIVLSFRSGVCIFICTNLDPSHPPTPARLVCASRLASGFRVSRPNHLSLRLSRRGRQLGAKGSISQKRSICSVYAQICLIHPESGIGFTTLGSTSRSIPVKQAK